jgi:hypothetical protein
MKLWPKRNSADFVAQAGLLSWAHRVVAVGGIAMRPVRILATIIFVAALAGTGCTSRSADQTAAPGPSGPSSAPTTHSTAASTTHPANRRVDRDHDSNHGHPGQPHVCHLPHHGTSGVSGYPCLPPVRSLRTGRRQLRSDGASNRQGDRRWPGGGLVCGAQRLCWLPLPGQKRHLPGQGPPKRQGCLGDLHGHRLTGSLAEVTHPHQAEQHTRGTTQLQPQPADQAGVSSRAADQTMLSGHGHMSPPPANDPETTDPRPPPGSTSHARHTDQHRPSRRPAAVPGATGTSRDRTAVLRPHVVP